MMDLRFEHYSNKIFHEDLSNILLDKKGSDFRSSNFSVAVTSEFISGQDIVTYMNNFDK